MTVNLFMMLNLPIQAHRWDRGQGERRGSSGRFLRQMLNGVTVW